MKHCVHIYCGDGKGKTSAAVGLAVRAAGCGKRVVIARFLKTDNSGEVEILKKIPEVTLIPCRKTFGFVRSMDEVARQLPKELLDATYSLGATRLEAIKVAIRQIAPGIATATLLSVGRAIGDAAGVMFTAGFTDSIPTSLNQPAATLPLSIFFQLSSPTPEVRERAYAAALLLTIIVLILSIIGRMITYRFSKNKIK